MKKVNILSIIIIAIIISGCATKVRYGDFTVASSNNVRNLNYSSEEGTKVSTKGETCIKNILGISLGDKDARIQRAMDAAIKNGHNSGIDGDLLVNVRIENIANSFVFYGYDCVVVSGDLVKIDTAK